MSKKSVFIKKKIEANLKKQQSLRLQRMKLHNEYNNLQDKLNRSQDYREKLEPVKEGRKTVQKLIGRTYWQEEFKDEDGGQSVFIERSQICTIDGQPCNMFGELLEYYDLTPKK